MRACAREEGLCVCCSGACAHARAFLCVAGHLQLDSLGLCAVFNINELLKNKGPNTRFTNRTTYAGVDGSDLHHKRVLFVPYVTTDNVHQVVDLPGRPSRLELAT